MEKKRSFQIFLKQFLVVFRNWEPINLAQSREAVSVASTTEGSKLVTDVVLGCSFGHPAEIILCLIEELEQITILINECKLALYFLKLCSQYFFLLI